MVVLLLLASTEAMVFGCCWPAMQTTMMIATWVCVKSPLLVESHPAACARAICVKSPRLRKVTPPT